MSVAGYLPLNASSRGVIRDLERETFLDDLVAEIAGSLAMIREPCYGAAQVTDDQIWERSRAIATRLVLGYRVEPLE